MISDVMSTKVVATVASVVPYVLRTFEFGKLFKILFAVMAGNTSPQNRKVCKLFISLLVNSDDSKYLLIKDGVDTQVLQLYFFNRSKNSI